MKSLKIQDNVKSKIWWGEKDADKQHFFLREEKFPTH